MSVPAVEPVTGAPVEPPAAAPTPPAPVPTDPPAAPVATTNPWADPVAAEAEIKRLRAENGKDRTTAKAQAAEDARKELAASIGKLLDPLATEPTDPAALAEQVTTSQADAKRARVELAVFRNAATAGADPAALLDSASFLEKVATLDPADAAAITAAITSAVEANPRLGVAPAAPKAPAPNPAQGASAGTEGGAVSQLSEADVQRMYSAKEYGAIEKARAEGRLNAYLGLPN